jgi:hypothetical protein
MDARIKSGHDDLDDTPNNKGCGHPFPDNRSP